MSLFERSPKGLTLTLYGEKILEEAQSILLILERWHTLADSQFDSDTINISSRPFLSSKILFDVISTVQKERPNLQVQFTDDLVPVTSCQDVVSAMTKANCSIALFVLNDTRLTNQFIQDAARLGYEITLLMHDTLLIYTNKLNPIAQKDYVSIADLHQQSFISYTQNKEFAHHILNDIIPPHQRIAFSNIADILMYVSKISNAFAALLTDVAESDYMRDNICALPLQDYDLSTDIFLLHSPRTSLTENERYVIRLIKDSI